MCGIFGILDTKGGLAPAEAERLLLLMSAATRHRGPDDRGLLAESPGGRTCAVGMNRLSIVDVAGGAQPIFNEDRSLAIVFNGEIYNYRELAAELAAKGHTLATRTDTEVVLHLYEQEGPDGLARLDGMFALAILHRNDGTLFLARDRFGVKPLLVSRAGGRFAFASESRALRLLPWFSTELDPQAVSDYFSLWYAPAPRSIWRDAEKLMPASWLRLRPDGREETGRFWAPVYRPRARSRAALREEYFDVLRRSVTGQLIGERPIGVFLSGGFDSGAIAWALSEKQGRNPFQTFSMGFTDEGFADESFDESGLTLATVRAFRCNHTHRYFQGRDVPGLVDRVTDALDEPLGITAYPYYELCRTARRDVTVALAGDGGDELLGGYDTYCGHALLQAYRRIPGPLRRAVFRTLLAMTPVSYAKRGLDVKLRKFMEAGELSPERGHVSWREIFAPEDKARLLDLPPGYDPSPHHAFAGALENRDIEDMVNRLLCADLSVFLPEACLSLADRVGMAHSLEVRVPLLSNDFFDFAASLPISWKVRGLTTKRLARTFLAEVLPREVVRAPKFGFAPPFSRWILGCLRGRFEDLVSNIEQLSDGLLNHGECRRVLDEHLSGRRDNHRKLMLLFGFANWNRVVRHGGGPA